MRTGRPNKGADHVDALDASAGPRERLRVILETLSGSRSVADACRELGVSHTRFKQLRRQALQGAADALEPGVPGRPRKRGAQQDERVGKLEAALAEADRARRREALRADLATMLPELVMGFEKGASRTSSTTSIGAEALRPWAAAIEPHARAAARVAASSRVL